MPPEADDGAAREGLLVRAGAQHLTHTKGNLTTDEESFLLLLRNRKKLSEILPKPIIP